MTNALYKDTRTTFVAGSAGVPSFPGTPGAPAYLSYDTQTVCAFQPVVAGSGEYEYVQDPYTGLWFYIFKAPSSFTQGNVFYEQSWQYVCQSIVVPVYHPAVPPIPPVQGVAPSPDQTFYDYNLGWNGGARSVQFFNGSGYAQFNAPRALIGAVVGLNDADVDASYPSIDYGFYFSGGIVRVYEGGVEKFYGGPYTDQQTFRMERRSGTVRYYQGGSLIYTSATPSLGTLFMDTSLYSGGDYIDVPSIGDLADVALSLQPLAVNGGDVAFAQATLTLQPLTLVSHPFSGAALALQPLTALGGSFAGSTAGTASTTLTLTIPGASVGTATGTITSPVDADDGSFTAPIVLTGPGGTITGTITGTYTTEPDGSHTLTGTVTGTDSLGNTVTVTVVGTVTGTGSGTLPVAGTLPGTDSGTGTVNGTVTGTVTGLNSGSLAGNTSYGSAALTLQPLTLDSHVGLATPSYALASLALAPLILGAHGLTGTIGGATLSLQPLGASGADHAYGEARLSLRPLTLSASAYEGNAAASMGNVGITSSTLTGEPVLVVVISEQGQVTEAYAVQTISNNVDVTPPAPGQPASTDTGAGALLGMADTMDAGAVFYALLTENAAMDAFTPVFGTSVGAPATVTGTVTGTGTGSVDVPVTGTVVGTGTSTGTGSIVGTVTLDTGPVSGTITGTVTGTVGAGGVFTGTFTGTDAFGNVITGTVTGIVTGTIAGPLVDDNASVWVVNWDSGASARYENYSFNSFAQIGASYYGCRDDGIYLLEGDDDAGTKIRASIDFGKQDFGTGAKKRVPHAYVGVSSSGTMYLKVIVEGTEYVYAARRADDTLRMQRIDLGKGLAANYMTFQLYNHDGGDFEFESIEFQYAEMTRRI